MAMVRGLLHPENTLSNQLFVDDKSNQEEHTWLICLLKIQIKLQGLDFSALPLCTYNIRGINTVSRGLIGVLGPC